MPNNSQLVLGTAQIGFPYGIANKYGKPDRATALAIVSKAWEKGITTFDTAQSYGNSEFILGGVLYKLGINREANIISKLDHRLDHLDSKRISKSIEQSLQNLKVPYLKAILLHREEQLNAWDQGLVDILQGLIRTGMVQHIGVSVYTPLMAIKALQKEGINLVQFPANLIDCRFFRENVFDFAAHQNKMVFLRSIFLQGLLLMRPEELPRHMTFVAPILKKIKKLAEKYKLSVQELALLYVKEKYKGAYIIFGAENPEQVEQNSSCWGKSPPSGLVPDVEATFPEVDETILNPTLWPTS